MRYILLAAALIPVSLSINKDLPKDLGPAGYGRGLIVPPNVAEMKQIECLATMVYGEARGEKKIGQIAVAYSAMNRAKGKKTLCDVVLAPKQYSIFNNNPALRAAALSLNLEPVQKNIVDKKSWAKAKEVAELVAMKRVPDPTNGATHYVAPKAMAAFGYTYPKWTYQYKLVAVIDNHKFYTPFYPKKVKKLSS